MDDWRSESDVVVFNVYGKKRNSLLVGLTPKLQLGRFETPDFPRN